MTWPDRRPRRSAHPTDPRETRHDGWLLAGLVLLGVIVPLAVSFAAGSLEIPRNDDWSYRRISLELARSGHLALDGASQTMIVGQILFAQPFLWLAGLQPWAFTAAGVFFAVGAMVSAYAMARQVLPAGLAVVPVLLLVFFPGYLAYATSFMSDVPALAAAFGCLALGAMALKRRPVSTGLLVASVVVGFVAFSIRDFAVAAPASVVLASICAEPRRARHRVVGVGVTVACIGLYVWRSSLAGQLGDVAPRPFAPANLVFALSSVAMVMSPAAIIAAARWRHVWKRFDVLIGLEIGLLIVGLRAVQWLAFGRMPPVFIENLASQTGVPAAGYVVGGRPVLFPDPVWLAINLLALGATVITLAVGAGIAGTYLRRAKPTPRAAVARLGSAPGVLLLFVLATTGGLALFGLRYAFFDRYLWPVIPPLATLFLYMPADLRVCVAWPATGGWRSTAPVGVLVAGGVLAVMSLIYLLNSHAFDIARWRAGDALASIGIPGDQIDAGYEWMGYHATTIANAARPAPGPTFYRGWWPAFQLCGLVSSDPRPPDGADLIHTVTYELNLVSGPAEKLYLYRMRGPECASVPAD